MANVADSRGTGEPDCGTPFESEKRQDQSMSSRRAFDVRRDVLAVCQQVRPTGRSILAATSGKRQVVGVCTTTPYQPSPR
jgi:hypothetical protein